MADQSSLNACTIVARNYLAQASVLANSFLEQHPGSRFVTLVLDETEPRSEARYDVVTPYDIGLDRSEVHRMAAIYDIKEFATAVKPALLRTLLADGEVAYFDPDIEFFAPLLDVAKRARKYGIVLTPHTMSPLPRDGCLPDERMLLQAGIYNLGFIGVGAKALPFLDWWAERLARDCIVAVEQALFVDQRWIDFVPALYDHFILRDHGSNVAYWNLHERALTWTGEGYEVNGVPLRFFHFSGFSPLRPDVVSSHMGDRPRIRLDRRPDLRRIFTAYAEKLLDAGFAESGRLPYRFDFTTDGTPIDRSMRRLFRDRLIVAERSGTTEPPNPFENSESFIEWLHSPSDDAATPSRSSVRQAIRRRQNLARRVRKLFRHQAPPPAPEAATDASVRSYSIDVPLEPTPGVNLVGYLRAELGIAEVARKLAAATRGAGVPLAPITYRRTVSREQSPLEERESRRAPYDVNVICVNADQLPLFRSDVGPALWHDRYTIGVWFWEVSEFPDAYADALNLVDEVWVASAFVADAVRAKTTKPVHTVPLPIESPIPPERTRTELGLPAGFLFLYSFDFLSVFERKNPLGALEAFTAAFAPAEGPVLVLKSINGDRDPAALERLRTAAAGRPDIVVIDGYINAGDRDALMSACDCYVSLHRSEGYGLTIAEAMAAAKPVVVTGYSGNLDFTTERNSYLVGYDVVPVPEGCAPYPTTSVWAEPDRSHAAQLLRHVWKNQDEARAVGALAREQVLQRFAVERTAEFVRQRIEDIRASGETSWPITPEIPAVRDAMARVQRGPDAALQRGAAAATPAGLVRRILHKALWPHLLEQHALQTSLAEAVSELEVLRYTHARTVTRLAALEDALSEVDPELGRIGSETANRLEAIESALSLLTVRPYMSDPALFDLQKHDGEHVLGYAEGTNVESRDFYRGFEEIFRGQEGFIRERQRVYADLLGGRGRVVDLGCGRGELLEILREDGVQAMGVDLDEGMIERCRSKGLDVELADATDFLERAPDGSLGAIFAAQLIEHLQYDDLVRLFRLAHAKLTSEGIFVAETVNPHAIGAFKMFWIDLTHRSPIYPEVALAFARLVGFGSAEILFPNGEADAETDRRTAGEYALVARRGQHSG